MNRFTLAVLFLFCVSAGTATGQPTAVEAKQAFDQLQKQWVDLTMQLRQKHRQQKTSPASEQGPLGEEIQKLRGQSEAMVGQIVAAGLDVYRADPNSYPLVNKTLVAIAGFYVTGDDRGDGGDQYEKALPIINSMLAAGAGKESPILWLWGGVCAYQTNDYDLARKYFNAAHDAGLLSGPPPSNGPNDPRSRIWDLAEKSIETLTANQADWEKEKEIRAAEAEADDLPRVKFQTSGGEVVIELFENEAPQAVANFITLVKRGYYDGIVFHRVLPSFMAQGGDPTGTGKGGPGYSIRCECHQSGYRKHFRGSMSMAHAGRDTGGSQFFLTFVSTSYLNGRHTVFGRVIEGMDVASSIKRRNPDGPVAPDKIIKATVLRDRGHAYEFEKLPER